VEVFKDTGFYKEKNYLPKTDWRRFYNHIASLAFNSELLRTYWYTVAKIIFKPNAKEDKNVPNDTGSPAKTKLESIILRYGSEDQKKDFAGATKRICSRQEEMQKRFDGWKKQEDGIAFNSECLEFRRAGMIKFNLLEDKFETEKEVDVQLATDLLEFRNIYDVAILISGDQDFTPAVKVIKNHGKRVVNVSFTTRGGKLLPGGAYVLNQICDKTLIIDYHKLAELLSIDGRKTP